MGRLLKINLCLQCGWDYVWREKNEIYTIWNGCFGGRFVGLCC